jgi:nicotinate-nucleotide pyrophosphorylase
LNILSDAASRNIIKYPNLPLIVEVENLTQLQQVLPLDGVERVLCDNFSIADLAQPKMIYSRLFSLPQALIEKPSASQLNRKDRSIA